MFTNICVITMHWDKIRNKDPSIANVIRQLCVLFLYRKKFHSSFHPEFRCLIIRWPINLSRKEGGLSLVSRSIRWEAQKVWITLLLLYETWKWEHSAIQTFNLCDLKKYRLCSLIFFSTSVHWCNLSWLLSFALPKLTKERERSFLMKAFVIFALTKIWKI